MIVLPRNAGAPSGRKEPSKAALPKEFEDPEFRAGRANQSDHRDGIQAKEQPKGVTIKSALDGYVNESEIALPHDPVCDRLHSLMYSYPNAAFFAAL